MVTVGDVYIDHEAGWDISLIMISAGLRLFAVTVVRFRAHVLVKHLRCKRADSSHLSSRGTYQHTACGGGIPTEPSYVAFDHLRDRPDEIWEEAWAP